MPDIFLQLDHKPFLGLSAPTVGQDGATTRRYRKEVIKVGQYHKESDNQDFAITGETLKHWAATFHEMRRNGVKVPIPVDHSEKAADNRGWVEDLFVEGDTLVMACELSDRDVENLVKRNDVSLQSPPEWTDGKGNQYVRPITHISLTPVPVVPGLDAFMPIAASFKTKGTTMDWKKLGADIGIDEELTDKNAAKLILSHVGTLTEAAKKATETANAATLKLNELEKASKKPAGDEPPPIDPLVLSLTRKNRVMVLNGLVGAARLTPAMRDVVKKAKIDGEALTLDLSHGSADDFDFWMKIIAENDPVTLKEQTGPQTLELGRPKGNNDDKAGEKWDRLIDARKKQYATA